MYKLIILIVNILAFFSSFSQRTAVNFSEKKELIERANSWNFILNPNKSIKCYSEAEKLGFIDVNQRILWASLLTRKGKLSEAEEVLLHPDTFYSYCLCVESNGYINQHCFKNKILNSSQLKRFRSKNDTISFYERLDFLIDSLNTNSHHYKFFNNVFLRDQEYRVKILNAKTKNTRDSLWSLQGINDSINRLEVNHFFNDSHYYDYDPNLLLNLRYFFLHQMHLVKETYDSLWAKNQFFKDSVPLDFFFNTRFSYLRKSLNDTIYDPFIQFKNGRLTKFSKKYLATFLKDLDNRTKYGYNISFVFYYRKGMTSDIRFKRKVCHFFRSLRLKKCHIQFEALPSKDNNCTLTLLRL